MLREKEREKKRERKPKEIYSLVQWVERSSPKQYV